MKITRTTKKCPICGTTFTPKTINSRYCSEQCSRKAYKRKVAEEKRQQELDAIAENVAENVAEKIMSYIENDKFITAKTLSEKLSLSSRHVQRIMTQLKTDNKIKRIGSDKGGYWEVVKK